MEESQSEEDEEEDEETLQLKLQEIQARLKLKKLQKAKSKKDAEGAEVDSARPDSALRTQTVPAGRGTAPARNRSPVRPASQNAIQIPASPVRKLQPPQLQTSPSRVLLGIDKGLRGKDMSLKRAPSLRKVQDGSDTKQQGGYLKRSRTPNPNNAPQEDSRPMTFNERLASARSEELTRAERQQRIQNLRTNAFGIGREEMERYKSSAVEIPDEPLKAPEFSREDILSTHTKLSGGLRRSNTVPSVRTQPEGGTTSSFADSSDLPTQSSRTAGTSFNSDLDPEASIEAYSGFHISKRIIPHPVLARHLSGKKAMVIKDLLREVKSPDYSLPDVEQDVVIFGIVAKKSDPRAHKPAEGKKAQPDREKYMVITLVDLQFELDLFLFNSGFTRFWKITEGTVVAILNPGIMPPPPGRQDSGRFSLTINSDADTIVEVGMARDLGFCKSVKKDGNQCGSWVNKKRTDFCEFHTNEALRKQRSSRIEVNQASFGRGPSKKNKKYYPRDGHNGPAPTQAYDNFTKSHWFMSNSLSAADLIDGKDNRDGTIADRKEKEEALKKRMAAREKEVEMMKKLGQHGSGAGRDYMRASSNLGSSVSSTLVSNSSTAVAEAPGPIDAKILDLLAPRGKDQAAIRLSPIKRKRPESAQSSSTTATTATNNSLPKKSALGWGGNLKDKLARMKDGEKLAPARATERSPVRKKTRFVTEKGIREAGRESLGTELGNGARGRVLALVEDDEEDELVIVR